MVIERVLPAYARANTLSASLKNCWAPSLMLARPNAGILTQPISCIGLPVVAAPVGTVADPDGGSAALPVGMQIIAAPWREDVCFRVARALERCGAARFKAANAD